MHIEISKSADDGLKFKVCVIDPAGKILRMFRYRTIASARRAAAAWTVAYNGCWIDDKTGEP